jgi:hypothetical protein
MGKRDPRVDAYIRQAPAFAKPILTHLRAKVHEAVPEVEEAIKWGVPHFDHHGPMCTMAAFKAHCRFAFWSGSAADGARPVAERIETVADLPSDRALLKLIRQAAALRQGGARLRRSTAPKPPVKVPSYFLDALRGNRKALTAFEAFSPSHRREYVEWITEAKTEGTRERRLETAVVWIAEGKPRNWKYMKTKA